MCVGKTYSNKRRHTRKLAPKLKHQKLYIYKQKVTCKKYFRKGCVIGEK